jgi:glutamyl-Q tRNA(Asp) synthetase
MFAPAGAAPSVSRFAPSPTGEAHPGTLLSALLVWLDARASGHRTVLRIENLDHTRCRADWQRQLVDDLHWLGLEWDHIAVQSQHGHHHAAALDRLAADGRLYPCTCSRRDRTGGRRAPDGGWAYDNTCRARAMPPHGWRTPDTVFRARLDDGWLPVIDDGGGDLAQDPAADMGDPVVVRRDGVVAYQLAVVVDDAACGVTHVVRGRDIAPSTATQVRLQQLLGLPTPRYRHHLLLLADRDGKLAKLHGSIPASTVRRHYDADALCGFLAYAAGLVATPTPCPARELLAGFAWSLVGGRDRVVRWTGTSLALD